MPAIIHLDYETFSKAPLGGKESVGAFRYAFDPSTEILLAGLWLDDGSSIPKKEDVKVWVNPSLEWGRDEDEQTEAIKLLRLCANPGTIIYAHNAPFEVAITLARWGKDIGFSLKCPSPDQFRCTMAMARLANLPPALEDLGEVLNLPQQKDIRGHNLIRKFSVPQKEKKLKPTTNPKLLAKRAANPHRDRIMPDDSEETRQMFATFIDYCRQDVVVEVACHRKLSYFEMQGDILDLFQADMRMNVRGFPVNLRALRNAELIMQQVEDRLGREFYELTGLKHTQMRKALVWMKERGFTEDDMQAATLESFIEENPQVIEKNTPVGQCITLMQKLNFAAIKKIRAMLRMAGPHDNKVRGTLTPFGAGPGRWTGHGVQPQNFKRPSQNLVKDWFEKWGYKDEDAALSDLTANAYEAISNGLTDVDVIEAVYGPALELLSSCIRHFIHDCEECPACEENVVFGIECDVCGGSGHVSKPMLSADYSAIEARTVAWTAYQDDALQLYREGVCRYKHMASKIYRVPYDKVNKFPQRFVGKQAILLLGYQGGGAKFRTTCEKYGYFDLEEDLEFEVVKMFRSEHELITKLWPDSEKAARKAIINHGQRFKAGRCAYYTRKTGGIKYLFCVLPSGREIAYPFPKVEPSLSYTHAGKRIQIVNPTAEDIQRADRRCGKQSEKWGDGGYMIKEVVTYYAKLEGKSLWGRSQVYGGLLVENQSQGEAFDFMACGMLNAEREGYLACNVIHDELLCYKSSPDQTADRLVELMTKLPAWAPDFPLAAEGAEVPYYTK